MFLYVYKDIFLNIYVISEKNGGKYMKKIKGKKIVQYGFIILLMIAIFSLSVISMSTKENEIVTNASAVSNQKIGWGIKRNNNHEQPDCRKYQSKSVRRKCRNLFR